MLTFHHSALFLRDIQFLLVTIHVKHSQGDERYIFWTDVFFKINNNHFFFLNPTYISKLVLALGDGLILGYLIKRC